MPNLEDFASATFRKDEFSYTEANDGEDPPLVVEEAAIRAPNGTAHAGVTDAPFQIRYGPGLNCESKRLYKKDNGLGIVEWVEDMPDNFKNATECGEAWAEFALLLHTHLVNNQQKLHSIIVQSPLLKSPLNGVFEGYPGFFTGESALTLEAPFKPFVHRWKAFVDTCNKDQESDTTRHLQLLRSILEPELQATFATISDFKAHGGIEFNQLWMVFEPGSLVLATDNRTECAYKIIRTENRISREEKREFFVLHVCFVDYDGKRFGYALHMVAIGEFRGGSKCEDLGVYPLNHHPSKSKLVQKLMARGEKFEALATVAYKAYDGHAMDLTDIQPTLRYVRIPLPNLFVRLIP